MNNIQLYIEYDICHISFIHSVIDRHLGYFCVLLLIEQHCNKQGNEDIPKIFGFVVVLFLVIWGTAVLFSIVVIPIYIPMDGAQGFPFSTSSPLLIISCLFDDSYSTRCQRYPIVFFTYFSMMWWSVMPSTFSCICWPFEYLPWKNSYSCPLTF